MSFDLTIAFDKAEYLNPQLYMFVDTLKDNIPEDTVLHVVTNRRDDNPVLKYISKNIHTKIYKKEKTDELKSRCRYMLNCFDIETDKPWVIKMESDMLVLKHLSAFDYLTDLEIDLFIEPENRRIFYGAQEQRLWRNIYKSMGIKKPDFTIQFRENKELGLPLYGTGLFGVKSNRLEIIKDRWPKLTKLCEPWLDYNTHPNEQAFTGMTIDEDWETVIYDAKFKFNPIGHFRKGDFPSSELIDDCVLPEDTVIFDYHRPEWLMHVAKYNKNIGDIICRNSEYIPDTWWELTNKDFMEK